MYFLRTLLPFVLSCCPGAMCFQACCALHALWGILYTAGGSIQMVAGVIFLLALPNFKFGSNIATGFINVLLGVVTIMITCLGNLNSRKCYKLLFISLVILTVNVVNLVILEIGEWHYFLTTNMEKIISESGQMKEKANHARLSTSITTAAIIVLAFIDSQLTFCSKEYLAKAQCRYAHSHENDIEYVIPRDKIGGSISKGTSFHHCSQAWVYDAENGTPSESESSYHKIPPSASLPIEAGIRNSAKCQASEQLLTTAAKSEKLDRKDNGTDRKRLGRHQSFASARSSASASRGECDYANEEIMDSASLKVQVNKAAEDANEVDRQLNHMKTFYRTPSRGGIYHQPSFSSVPPVYECLEKLTQPKTYMSRLDIYKTVDEDVSRPASASSDYPKPPHSPEHGDKVHYAALVAELEKTLDKKKDSKSGSAAVINVSGSIVVDAGNRSDLCLTNRIDRERGSDATFSKELEAALKLIQDLETPNTVDTPSDTCTLVEDAIDKCGKSREDEDDTGSNKTLSENSSPEAHGKNNSTLPVESQSTSGFNSLSHERSNRITPTPGFSSDDVSVSKDSGLACIIRHKGETAIISLFSPTKEPHFYSDGNAGENRTVAPGQKLYVNKVNVEFCQKKTESMIELKTRNSERDEKTGKSRLAKWKQLLDRRRRPSLLPEVESAIIKSECLAFLSDNELKDRLNQTKSIHRQIEAKVHRQRSFRRTESFGSVEDILDRFNTTTRL